ncbi:UDP-3-O-(3-hydroxymyristoyl)glucosamine N-acyltransferase [Pseudahrensia aquimaris]|uniref:UDP-3-O-acylglucosamine N-acyltransferase n=1 Tax=Pseudahrensia aquimaris TaxID=744461 RepID=A0ABW3FG85_9HYPH
MAEGISFFDAPAPITLGELAPLIGCTLASDDISGVSVLSVAPIEAAAAGALTFLSNAKYIASLNDTGASAVICSASHAERVSATVSVLISDDPYRSFARAVGLMFPSGMRPQPFSTKAGVSPQAHVDPTAEIEDGAIIEAGAVIGAKARIGAGSLIGPTAIVGPNVHIGRNSSICGGVSVVHSIIGDRVIVHNGARLGCDGFGFSMGAGGHLKIPQIGRVVVQDDVEIGANTTIDRGANRDTIIGEGTKIDNQVMIGHNVQIGRHCVIVAQSGIAGSAELGDYVVLGGKCAVNGHVKIGSGAQIAGLSGVSENVAPGMQLGGVPARPIKIWMREIARLKREARAAEGDRKSKEGNRDE